MKHETFPKIIVRLPPEIKEWLEAEADYNVSSQTSEIVRALRERMERVAMQRGERLTSKAA